MSIFLLFVGLRVFPSLLSVFVSSNGLHAPKYKAYMLKIMQ